LLTAINLCNYNQANSQVNGLVGVGSFVSAKVKLWSIIGGNTKIVKSAFQQAQSTSSAHCGKSGVVRHVPKHVTSVIADLESMELFSETESLGYYDVVVLAAPIQQSRISFLIKSDKDSAVLHDMPLFGDSISMEEKEADDLQSLTPTKLPESVSRPYTQVVTTVISNATLEASHFLMQEHELPRGIYMTEKGREEEFGITAISQLTSDGVYKIFSGNVLEERALSTLFGYGYVVEYTKVWGGQYGGATPDYRGQGASIKYTLYDSSRQVEGFRGSVLYYPNAIEASFACMELSAIGAKSVARLAARRLGMLVPQENLSDSVGNEL
jgi:prenylcysteine oxidase/farnesylcysteine lyase